MGYAAEKQYPSIPLPLWGGKGSRWYVVLVLCLSPVTSERTTTNDAVYLPENTLVLKVNTSLPTYEMDLEQCRARLCAVYLRLLRHTPYFPCLGILAIYTVVTTLPSTTPQFIPSCETRKLSTLSTFTRPCWLTNAKPVARSFMTCSTSLSNSLWCRILTIPFSPGTGVGWGRCMGR